MEGFPAGKRIPARSCARRGPCQPGVQARLGEKGSIKPSKEPETWVRLRGANNNTKCRVSGDPSLLYPGGGSGADPYPFEVAGGGGRRGYSWLSLYS